MDTNSYTLQDVEKIGFNRMFGFVDKLILIVSHPTRSGCKEKKKEKREKKSMQCEHI